MKIYHLISEDQLKQSLKLGDIIPSSLHVEGFCHCCFRDQILTIANRFFHNNVVHVYEIESTKLTSKLIIEDDFPHVYGKINQTAVLKSFKLQSDVDNGFVFPQDLFI